MATERISEYSCGQASPFRVDRSHGIISGVKILGRHSKNKREYLPNAVEKSRGLYENAAVFVNHAEKGSSRRYQDRIGSVQNVSVKEGELYGDLHYNPRHPLAEQLAWDAEHSPQNVGLSHDVEARTSRKGDTTIVEEILKVDSVDLVAKPATVKSLYEDEQSQVDADPELAALAESVLSVSSDVRSALFTSMTVAEKRQRLSEIIAGLQKELTGNSQTQESNPMEWKEVTLEGLKEHCPTLVAQLTGTDEASTLQKTLKESQEALKAASDKLAALEAEKAKLAKDAAIAAELKEAKLDAANKAQCSEVFLESLNAAADAAARKRLIEDRVAVLKPTQTPPQAPMGAAPFANVAATETAARPKRPITEAVSSWR